MGKKLIVAQNLHMLTMQAIYHHTINYTKYVSISKNTFEPILVQFCIYMGNLLFLLYPLLFVSSLKSKEFDALQNKLPIIDHFPI